MSTVAGSAARTRYRPRLGALRVLIAPIALIVIVALIGSALPIAPQQYFITALVSVTIVLAG